MKYYIVTLLDHLRAIECSRMLLHDNGAIQFWVDSSKEDSTAHYGRSYSHELKIMYSPDYWMEVREATEAEYRSVEEAEANASAAEGGLQ